MLCGASVEMESAAGANTAVSLTVGIARYARSTPATFLAPLRGAGNRILEMEITTSPLVKTYTLQEFWALPEPKEHVKLELIAGVLYMTPPPDFAHSRAVSAVNAGLVTQVVRCGYKGRVFIPRASIWLNNTCLEPDLMYISEETLDQMGRDQWTHAEIVIEVVSPLNVVYETRTKSDTYRAMGVRELWLIDPVRKEVEVRFFETDKRTIFRGNDLVKSEVLPKVR